MTAAPEPQSRFFLYRFCREFDARVRHTYPHAALQFCTVHVPSYVETSLLRATSFLPGAYIHDESGTNIAPSFGRSMPTPWASFLEREAVLFDQQYQTPAFLTQSEWDFLWRYTRGLSLALSEDLLYMFNSQFSRSYGTFHLLAAMINTFILPLCICRSERSRRTFRAIWNNSVLVQDVLGLPSLHLHSALPGPVSAADCRGAFLDTLFLNLDSGIECFRSEGDWRDPRRLADPGENEGDI